MVSTMAAQSKHVFSKILTVTDIKKRLAVPSAIQSCLPPFNGGHTVTFQFLHGTRPWPIRYTIRRKGYKKSVFSGLKWGEKSTSLASPRGCKCNRLWQWHW
uniref:TF-B3 domain-containing protein n=1 Tax=Gossypium raimondii TaxID=29730 RepID=A0A0D2S492_GOSRA|nr:hypothetical protein B456_012G169200 [Gossypium raimondii]